MNEQELCERLEGLGFSPGRLMRQASNETREAVSAVFSSGESNGDSSGAADGSSEQQRAQLQLIQDALQSQQDRFELGRVERHGLLRAIRHGTSVDAAQARFRSALEAQREADDRTFESSTLDMGGFSLDRGKTILVHAAAMLTAQDLGGAIAACRTMRRMVPQAVYALDGLNPSVLTDNVLNATLRRFSFISTIDLTGCHELQNVEAWPSELTTVSLSECSNLTDGAVEALASHCPGLTTVDLSYCHNLTDGAVEALASHCRGLTTVSLYGCKNLTDGAMEALRSLISQRGRVLNV